MLRDQDKIYGGEFCQRLKGLRMDEVITAPRSPFQNPYAERLVGLNRREGLDHVIILNENHLRAILRSYLSYYHEARPHLSLERNSPIPREVERPSKGSVIAIQQVGGLHHRHQRCA